MLSTDFSQLCCNQRFSDVIIRCGLEVFPAHKNILSARSSVFAEMLGNTPNDSKLSINDLEPTVMKAVLLYIYSGKTDLTTFQSTYDLLSAADRFCLNELKIIAINYIKRSLTVENVFECFYECKALQSYALEFMSKNFSLVKDTKQWEEFKQCRPDLITQLHEQSRKFFK
nr:speckle-type POZ protein-like [Parasteatoda tepidariorum]